MHRSIESLIKESAESGRSLPDVILAREVDETGATAEQVRDRIRHTLSVMRGAIDEGLKGAERSPSGLTGGRAAKLAANGPRILGPRVTVTLARAIATLEVNACMGLIVAAPTAGAAGVLPAILLSVGEFMELDDDMLINGMLVAGGIGGVIAHRASLSGAEGGCQAETGAAAGMAAGAATEMLGGTPSQVGHAVALTMQGTLGLVCDPLGGLVELPCVFRNATGSAIALAGIEMALAGITFAIPVDEVIDVMGEIGREMDVRYRETAGGGLAATPTGRKLAKERLYQIKRSDA
ncbi:MAG: L-serine ammonia-lyase, iron-sulfur-dependent, subunit alpha [Chloroflexota bacterium]|nr:L-serine ammonia-lyase, iron-sulfur-dependent, subunit alpha [Chloroflexota bacterium]